MNSKELIALLKNWQVALLVILLIASVFLIFPHIEEEEVTTNLQYGLDLSDGTWLQMEFQAEVVGFETDRPVGEFLTDLQKKLDAEIYLVDEDKIEIRTFYPREQIEAAFAESGGRLTSYEQGVSKETAEQVKKILEEKLNALGTKDAKVNPL
ncbi:MAG: preprotein translocase subunit SecD, partial [Methanoregulaceae archaeon]|nr:preprotein translocase subunit SecD [Methanoregulaceae archaeon]